MHGKRGKKPRIFFDNKQHNEVATYSKLTTMRPICIRILDMESTILDKEVQKLSNRSTKSETPHLKDKQFAFSVQKTGDLLLIRDYREANLGGKITRSKTH